MEWMTKEDLFRLVKLITESQISEFCLETAGLKLKTKRERSAPLVDGLGFRPETFEASRLVNADPAVGTIEALNSPVSSLPQQAPRQPEPIVFDEEKFSPIKSPMLGTFYSAPKPEAPPFVEVGQWITKDDVVCIVEVMKLFNTVRAGLQGRIAEICVENAQMVEYNQVLFWVEKQSAESAKEAAS